MMVTQHKVSGPTRTPTLKLPRKPSARDLKTTSGGRKNAESSLGRSTTLSHSPSKTPKHSPGRGLTLQIEDNVVDLTHPIKSAPVRTIRRLPSVPLPCPGAATAFPSSSTPFSTAAQFSTMPLSPRAKRPLPCPPAPTKDFPPTPQNNATLESSPPTTRRAVVKPLPIPVRKIEPLLPRPPLAAPQPNAQTIAPLTSTLRLTSPPSFKSCADKKHEAPLASDESPKTPEKSGALLNNDTPTRDERDAVMLHKRLMLERNARLSLDSDDTSEDEIDGDLFSEPLFAKHGRPSEKHEDVVSAVEKELHADYAWVLSNRILYQQNSSDGHSMTTSKWVREIKGKRYTEQDFDTVLKVLRTL